MIFTGWAEMQDPGSVAQGQGQGGMIQEVLASMGAGGTINAVCCWPQKIVLVRFRAKACGIVNRSTGRVTGPMDESAGGRVMSDTTCIFILDAYQVYLNTADLPFVKATWPHLVRAAQWQINRTIEGDGFPHHLQVRFEHLPVVECLRPELPAYRTRTITCAWISTRTRRTLGSRTSRR